MKKRCFPAALLALLLLLPGCTAEDRERTRENDRISALAQRDAARPVSYTHLTLPTIGG